ncbi:ribonuclease H-like domain-containing protein, partial [Tanacetum coccineum]
MKFESAQSNTIAKLPILSLAQENGTSVTKMSVPVTAEENTNKKNDVKDRHLLIMALPNEHQLTFSQYNDAKTMFAAIETRFGVITQEDLNSKFLRSLPPEWNTHVVVWMNKAKIETMSIDDLYNNFKIVEQSVKKSVGASSDAQNLAFMTAPSTSSTNDANTAKPAYEVSTVSPNVNTASHQDLEQIHEDGYGSNGVWKWQLTLVVLDCPQEVDTLTRECRAPRNKEVLAIDGVGFDWSDMAEEQVQTNMALMVFSDSKLPDESQILLKIPRKDNMYSFDMKNIVPKESLTCLCMAKGYINESMPSIGCLVHIENFKKHKQTCYKDNLDETSEILKNFIKEIENLVDKKVKIIRSDNGTKFKNKVMDDFCREKGIKREYSVARTPQQNGVAERRNRTLIEAARTMLADSKLPTTFWAEAVSTACYVQNRVLVVKPHNKTPYEIFRGFKLALSFMRPFRCHVIILNTLDNLGKFDGKSDEGFFVGYSLSSKAFRVYNTRTRRVEENLHIGFLENKPMIEGNGPKWLFDIDSLTQSMNYVPVAAGTITNESAGTQGELNAGTSTQKEDIIKLNPQALLKLYLIHLGWKQYRKNFCNSNSKRLENLWICLMGRGPLEQKGQEEGIDYEEVFAPVVYVDDIIFDYTNKKLCTGFEKLMKDKLQMSSMGELTFFLGLQVQQKEDGIFISQDKYVAKILKKFNNSDVNSASTPVNLEKPLVKDGDAIDVDVHLYISMIGSLMYLNASRPDIMFA